VTWWLVGAVVVLVIWALDRIVRRGTWM